MTARVALVALVLAAGTTPAALPPPADDLSRAYYAAVADLRSGKSRQEIPDRLGPVVEKNRASPYMLLAGPLLADLRATANTPPAAPTDPPEKRLADDTGGNYHLIRYAANRGRPLTEFMAKEPKSLLVELATADRGVIGRLIPLLTDRTPTRCDDGPFYDWKTPQPRVGDLALELVEFHGKARFPASPTGCRLSIMRGSPPGWPSGGPR